MKPRRLRSGVRPPAAVNVLMRRLHGDSAYKRSTKARRLKLCRKFVACGVGGTDGSR
jgi:hypothetical protein